MNKQKEEQLDNNCIRGLLRKVNPVVNKDGPLCPNSIYLAGNKPCVFGRASTGVTTQLVSRRTPLMISRKHATLGFRDGHFLITDHDSLNGVFVNGVRIESNDPYPIVSGDKIAFGIAVGNDRDPEFEYIFHQMPQEYTLKRQRVSDGEENHNEKKQKCDTNVCVQGESFSIESHNDTSFEERIRIQENKISELTEQLASKEQAHSDLTLTLEKKEQDLLAKLVVQREELEAEKHEAERNLQSLLEQQLLEKEKVLKANFEEKIKSVEDERDLVEQNLQKELASKLTERDEAYREELEKQKDTLNKILNEMEIERENRELEMSKNQELLNSLKSMKENEEHLGSCLEELKRQIQHKDEELLKQEEITKKAEEDGKKAVISQMEDEFTCMICHELFIDSVTLTCAHSFCEMCLRSWMKKKKECPVCRGKITGKAVRSVVLDSAIRKMIENADNETKQNREQLIVQRHALREAEQGISYIIIVDS